ncbi:hypothetical protein LSAT2_015157 [Lamellibrachia satsuma]|nr:hypothetical protein LSAT2_015157 [Lamellibrachia satsuma]
MYHAMTQPPAEQRSTDTDRRPTDGFPTFRRPRGNIPTRHSHVGVSIAGLFNEWSAIRENTGDNTSLTPRCGPRSFSPSLAPREGRREVE